MANDLGPNIVQDFGGFPVFNSQGQLQGNLTGNFGQPPSIIPGNSIDTGGVTTSLNGSTLSQGIQGSTISAPAGSSTPTKVTIPAPVSSGGGSLADYFARGIIIVLGFIFIAVGLNMLRPGTVPVPTRLRP